MPDPVTPANPATPPVEPAAPATPPVDPANPATPPAMPTAPDPANPDPIDPVVPDPANPDPANPDPANPEDPPAPADIELQLPEGYTLDEEIGGKFKEFAKAKGLSQEDAQSLLNMQIELKEKEAQAYVATQAEWVEQAKADKEFGGEKLDENLAVANKALAAFGTPELKTLLRTTGFGNHPEVIRAFVKIAKAVGEDNLVVKDLGAPSLTNSSESIAQRMYPNMNP